MKFGENGELKESSSGMSIYIKNSRFDGEFSFSIKELENEKDYLKLTTVISDSDGYSSVSFTIPKHLCELSYSKQDIQDTIEVEDGNNIVVWGLMVGEGATRQKFDESIEDMGKRVEWALVLKIRIDDFEE